MIHFRLTCCDGRFMFICIVNIITVSLLCPLNLTKKDSWFIFFVFILFSHLPPGLVIVPVYYVCKRRKKENTQGFGRWLWILPDRPDAHPPLLRDRHAILSHRKRPRTSSQMSISEEPDPWRKHIKISVNIRIGFKRKKPHGCYTNLTIFTHVHYSYTWIRAGTALKL